MSNVGTPDRIIRAIVGLSLIIVPVVAAWSTLALVTSAVIGVVLVVTAAIGFCPIYAAIGISSRRARRAGSH
jgi:hypothetical protein